MKELLKKGVFWFISITALFVVCVAVGFFGQSEDDAIDRIVGVVAIVSGIGSVVMGVSSIFSTSLDNVREYYATGDAPQMLEARHVLYNYRYIKIKFGKSIYDEDFDEWVANNITPEEKTLRVTTKKEIISAAATTTDFFQMWGLLQYRNFLPMWVFETASGYSVIKLYEAVEDIVSANRANNPFYAMHFQGLCVRIANKYRKAIRVCRENESEHIAKKLGIKDLSGNKYYNVPLK